MKTSLHFIKHIDRKWRVWWILTNMYPCNQHPNQLIEQFCHLREFSHVIFSEPYFTREASTLLIFSQQSSVLPIFIIHVNGIIFRYAFWRAVWHISVSKIFVICIHMVEWANLFNAEYYLIVWLYHHCFIHSHVGAHLGGF